MQTTSALYNQILADINHRFEVKLSINGVDYGVDSIFSAKTESRIFDSKPTIGGCYCATLDFTILSDGANIPRMASVVPYFRVANDKQQSEWIQHGLYYIDQRKTTNNGDGLSVFRAECFDAMLKANAAYSTSSLSWPALDTQIVPEIATAIGVPVDPRTTAILTKQFSIADLPVNYTYRDVLSFIAVAYAGNWIITDEGKLRLVPIAGNSDTLLIDKELMSMNVSPKRNGYTKVVITTSEGEAVESGLSDNVVMEAYCPYATQAIADDVLATLSTYQYEPFDASGVWSNPAVEVGDKITAVEKTVVSYARTVNFGPGMVMNLSAPDDGYIDHEYAYESPTERHYKQTIGDIKREIVVTAETITSTISRRLDNMQEQIDNNIETFTGSAVPTLTNYPANAWTTTEEKDKHIGDLYVVNSQGGDYEGFYYRFEKNGSTYQWRLLKDTEVTKALADAEEALRRVGIAETQIEQNAEAITLRATKTEAQGYANTAQANAISAAATDATTKANAAESAAKSYADAQITVSADAITSNVSATYETKTDATGKLNTAKTYAEGQASTAETNAKGYTDGKLTDYSTTTQMNSAISQSASNITSTVSATYETKADATSKLNTAKTYAEGQASAAEDAANDYTDGKLTDYSTTAQMNSAISQSAASITSTVSATYETKSDATSKLNTAKTYAETQASAAEDAANDYTDGKLVDYSTTAQMESAIEQTASSITSTVSATYETKTDATSKLNTAKTYADGKAATAESNAKTAAQGYADAAEENANDYTDGKLVDYSTTTQMESAISQSATDITSTVSATYETKAAATQKLNTAKSYAETQAADAEAAAISTAAADATTKANAAETAAKGYTDTKLTGYSTTTQMNSAISQSASQITQSVAATYTTKAEFADLKIGGRNYFKYSDDSSSWKSYTPSAYMVASISLWENLIKEQQYTVTIWGDVPTRSDKSDCYYSVYWGGGNVNLGIVRISDGKGSLTFTAPNNSHFTTENAWINIYNTPGSGSSGTVYTASITKVKIEDGNKSTDWTPAPEDFETEIDALETRVTSAESTLTVQAGQIASKVSETDYNGNTIASKINQTATTVKINAAKIDLQGAVTISDFDSAAQAALVKNTTTKNQYAQSASSTTAPTSGWQDAIPAYNATNKYIWLRVATTKTFADNTSSTTYSTAVVDVNLTKSIQDAAAAQTTANSATTAASNAQTTANNAASAASTAQTTANNAASAASTAQTTADNAATAASTAQTTANNAASAASTAQSTADAALGTTKSTQQYYLSTSSTSATGGTWQDTVPTWSSGKYVWTRIKTEATTKSGTTLSPVYSTAVYDANLTTALSTASSASSAASAAQSTADGAVTAAGTAQTTANNAASAASAAQTTANGAVKSSSVKTQYYLSTSASSATGGSWSDTIPAWADGKYLWTRIATTTTPVSGTASTTYQPSANGAYDSNLTNALSTATAAASTAAAAQATADKNVKATVSCYYRSTTNSTPSISTSTTIGTADDTDNAWSYTLQKPKKNTYFYTCERYTLADNTVTFSTVRPMSNMTQTALWCSATNSTYVDGANIYAGSVTATQIAANTITANKINLTDLFSQNITATNFHLSGGSVNITADSGMSNQIILTYDGVMNSMMPYGYKIFDENYQSNPMWEVSHTWGTNYKSSLMILREINGSGVETEKIELQPTGFAYFLNGNRKTSISGVGLSLYDTSGNTLANYGNYSLTLTNGSKSTLNNISLTFYGAGGGLLSQFNQTKLQIKDFESVEITKDKISFLDLNGTETFAYPSTGLRTRDLTNNFAEFIAESGTTKTYTLSNGVYLVVCCRVNNGSTTNNGIWLIQAHNGTASRLVLHAPTATNPTTVAVSQNTLTVTTGIQNIYLSVVKLT